MRLCLCRIIEYVNNGLQEVDEDIEKMVKTSGVDIEQVHTATAPAVFIFSQPHGKRRPTRCGVERAPFDGEGWGKLSKLQGSGTPAHSRAVNRRGFSLGLSHVAATVRPQPVVRQPLSPVPCDTIGGEGERCSVSQSQDRPQIARQSCKRIFFIESACRCGVWGTVCVCVCVFSDGVPCRVARVCGAAVTFAGKEGDQGGPRALERSVLDVQDAAEARRHCQERERRSHHGQGTSRKVQRVQKGPTNTPRRKSRSFLTTRTRADPS